QACHGKPDQPDDGRGQHDPIHRHRASFVLRKPLRLPEETHRPTPRCPTRAGSRPSIAQWYFSRSSWRELGADRTFSALAASVRNNGGPVFPAWIDRRHPEKTEPRPDGARPAVRRKSRKSVEGGRDRGTG